MILFSLGVNNIKHNFKNYFSYFVSTLSAVFILTVFYSIYYNKQIEGFSAGRVKVYTLFRAAAIVVIIFSALFIWYSNSFFIKSRKKEIAIYSLLGMKKKEVGMLLFCENIFLGVLALAIGLPLGVLASKFFLQILIFIMKARVIVKYELETRAIISSALVFMLLFLINSFNAYSIVYKFRLIELLSAAKEGEKAPKASAVLALLSIAMIFTGYVIAYTKTLQGGTQTIYFGFLVLVLVVTGTYILFNNLIIILLKMSKKNKNFYYAGENLISISQILYRIKANSNTLATIAVISAVAITALSFTFSMYLTLDTMPPNKSPFSLMYKGGDEKLNIRVDEIISRHKEVKVTYKTDIVMVNGKGLTPVYKGPFGKDLKAPFDIFVISKSEYSDVLNNTGLGDKEFERVKDINYTRENECFFIEVSNDVNVQGRLKGNKVKVYTGDNSFDFNIIDSDVKCVLGYNFQETTLVVPDSLFDKLLKNNINNTTVIRGYNVDDPLNCGSLIAELNGIIPQNRSFDSFYDAFNGGYSLLGSYVFIGLFLGILFVISTGSILYYKQLVEGSEDKERYNILKKIGVSKKETLHIVAKQLALIFGIPLLVGLLHSTAALAVYVKYCAGFAYLWLWIAAMIGVYVAIYIGYYLVSVKSYMGIVYK